MKLFSQYRHLGGLILFAALLLLLILRLNDVTSMVGALYSAVKPLLIGIIIAFILNIIVSKYENLYFKHSRNAFVVKTRRPFSILLAIVSILLIISFVMWGAIPQVVHSLAVAVKVLPDVYANVVTWSQEWISNLPIRTMTVANTLSTDNLVENATNLGTQWGSNIVKATGNAIGILFNFVIGLIFAIYILINKDELGSQFTRVFCAYLPDRWVFHMSHVLHVANDTFSKFFIGQFLDAFILGCMVTVGCLVLQLPYAYNIGCVIGLTALVPIIGAYVGGIIGLIMLLNEGPMPALIFVILLIAMQQIEGNFIYPRIVGGSVGLPGIWVFAAVTIGGSLYGVFGILFSVPLAATVYKLLSEDVNKRLAEGEDML